MSAQPPLTVGLKDGSQIDCNQVRLARRRGEPSVMDVVLCLPDGFLTFPVTDLSSIRPAHPKEANLRELLGGSGDPLRITRMDATALEDVGAGLARRAFGPPNNRGAANVGAG